VSSGPLRGCSPGRGGSGGPAVPLGGYCSISPGGKGLAITPTHCDAVAACTSPPPTTATSCCLSTLAAVDTQQRFEFLIVNQRLVWSLFFRRRCSWREVGVDFALPLSPVGPCRAKRLARTHQVAAAAPRSAAGWKPWAWARQVHRRCFRLFVPIAFFSFVLRGLVWFFGFVGECD
jgi:hypothetical protein